MYQKSSGMKNIPATFQRVLEVIPATVSWQYKTIYIKGITIFSISFKGRLKHMEEELRLLDHAKMSLKLK